MVYCTSCDIIYHIFVVPNLASFVLGFTDWSLYDFNNIKFNGLENFRRLFSEKTFAIAIKILLFCNRNSSYKEYIRISDGTDRKENQQI